MSIFVPKLQVPEIPALFLVDPGNCKRDALSDFQVMSIAWSLVQTIIEFRRDVICK
jgi:hypothetical protein